MNVTVTKLTDVELLRKANSFTTGHESHMTLAKAYAYQHSPIRTQLFWIECREIPLFVASQLVRSHVGVQFFQLSKRTDRGGEDFREACHCISQELLCSGAVTDFKERQIQIEERTKWVDDLPKRFDRYAPTDLAFIINAEALINMAHKRLCAKASPETREIFGQICELVEEQDPDLYKHLVPQCMYRGGICPEPNGCGYNKTGPFNKILTEYRKLFIKNR